ncbi:hypothetical protein TNCV_3122281 [Trichonephila clavipes]|nr:hypothetical protein TNCV_3122281 [Trichonephila clavipes]
MRNTALEYKIINEKMRRANFWALYGKDIDKVKLHMDKAPSNMSKSTAAYLAKKESETGIKCVPFDEIPVKSHDTSPIDLFSSPVHSNEP